MIPGLLATIAALFLGTYVSWKITDLIIERRGG